LSQTIRKSARASSSPSDAEGLRLVTRETFAHLDQPSLRAITQAVVLDADATAPAGLSDDAALDRWLAAAAGDYVQAAGTCAMGAPDDPAAVVDPHCRFIGVEDLYVADASIIPIIPRANTHLTAVIIAEKATALIDCQAVSAHRSLISRLDKAGQKEGSRHRGLPVASLGGRDRPGAGGRRRGRPRPSRRSA
jgi:choline dehydrogenase-like flavoprotein